MALGALQDYSARDSRGKTIDFTICFAVHTRNHLPTLYNMCVNIANNTSKIFWQTLCNLNAAKASAE